MIIPPLKGVYKKGGPQRTCAATGQIRKKNGLA
jgi:hypothetical protein